MNSPGDKTDIVPRNHIKAVEFLKERDKANLQEDDLDEEVQASSSITQEVVHLHPEDEAPVTADEAPVTATSVKDLNGNPLASIQSCLTGFVKVNIFFILLDITMNII